MKLLTVIVLLPLAGFLLNGLLGRRLGRTFVSVVGCGLPILAFLATLKACAALQLAGPDAALVEHVARRTCEVISVGALQVRPSSSLCMMKQRQMRSPSSPATTASSPMPSARAVAIATTAFWALCGP